MLFYCIETQDEEEWAHIVDINEDEAQGTKKIRGYSVRYEKADLNKVSTDELVNGIESRLEGENYHSEMHIPAMIVAHVEKVAGADVAKKVLLSIIEDRGFTLGL